MIVGIGDWNHTDQQWEEGEEFCRGDRESSEDETQRLFETLDAATISIKAGAYRRGDYHRGVCVNNGFESDCRNRGVVVIWNIIVLGMLLENVHEERKNVGFRKGRTSAVGRYDFWSQMGKDTIFRVARK